MAYRSFGDQDVEKWLDRAFEEGLTRPNGEFCRFLEAWDTGFAFWGRLCDQKWYEIEELMAACNLGTLE